MRQRRSQSCYQFDFTFTEVKGVSKEVIYLATSLTRVKGEVKANAIFVLTFDACQKCSKSNFSSPVVYRATSGSNQSERRKDNGGIIFGVTCVISIGHAINLFT